MERGLARIGRMNAGFIRENPLNPRNPRPIQKSMSIRSIRSICG